MKSYSDILAELQARKDRSAWDKGVDGPERDHLQGRRNGMTLLAIIILTIYFACKYSK